MVKYLGFADTARQVTIASGDPEAERMAIIRIKLKDQIEARDVSALEMAPASLRPVVVTENSLDGRG